MNLRTFVTGLLIFFVGQLFADQNEPSTGSEYQHQAASRSGEFLFDVDLFKAKTNLVQSSGSVSNTRVAATVTGEYGLNRTLSIGMKLPYLWTWTKYSTALGDSGDVSVSWADPAIFGKIRLNEVGPGSLRFQLDYARTIGYQTPGKNYSGGSTLRPAVGYEMQFEKHLIGIRSAYTFYVANRTISYYEAQPDYRIKGGETLESQLFYEYEDRFLVYGLSLTVTNLAKSTYTTVSSVAYNIQVGNGQGASGPYTSPSSDAAIRGYFPVDISPTFRVVPSLTYSSAMAYDTSVISSADIWHVGATARFIF